MLPAKNKYKQQCNKLKDLRAVHVLQTITAIFCHEKKKGDFLAN